MLKKEPTIYDFLVNAAKKNLYCVIMQVYPAQRYITFCWVPFLKILYCVDITLKSAPRNISFFETKLTKSYIWWKKKI